MKSIKLAISLCGTSLFGMENAAPVQAVISVKVQPAQQKNIRELDILPNPLHSLILDYCEHEYSLVQTLEYEHPVKRVTYSPDKKYFATISGTESGADTITLHTTSNNQKIQQFAAGFPTVYTGERGLIPLPIIEQFFFSADSKELFCHVDSMSNPNQAFIWREQNGWEARITAQKILGQSIGYSADTKTIITSPGELRLDFVNKGAWLIQVARGDDTIWVKDTKSRQAVHSFAASHLPWKIVVSPDNSLIALRTVNTIELCDFPTGTNSIIIREKTDKDEFLACSGIQFSHDGNILFYAIDKILYAYDLKTKASYEVIQESEKITSFCVNAQKQIAIAVENKVKIYVNFVHELITRPMVKNNTP